MPVDNIRNNLKLVEVSFQPTATTSSAGAIPDQFALVALQCSAVLEGTAITFQGSLDGSTYVALYAMDGGSAYSVTVGTSRIVPVDIRVFAGIPFVKLVSNAAAGEDAVTTIILVARPV